MAKPRVFVSSTYYDLKHIRNNLESFISQLGYESVLFESGDIPFFHSQPLDESCYSEINNCHILVLIIGGRYGSATSEDKAKDEIDKLYRSITKKEYETARQKDIPIYIFVEKQVMSEFETYKGNKNNNSIIYAHVDSVGVFHLLEEILSQGRNNLTKEFEKFDEIATWLTDQWAGLFADFLSKKSADTTLRNLSSQIEELKQLSDVLKSYNESIIRELQPDRSKKIIGDSDRKLRLSKANRFVREPMVKFICRKAAIEMTPSQIYSAFGKSSDVEDFLKLLKTTKEFISEFMQNNGSHAIEDYKKLADKYLERETINGTIDEEDDFA